MQRKMQTHTLHKIFFGDVQMNRDLYLLLLIGGLYALGIALSNTFVNIYLWKQQNDFWIIAYYNLFTVLTQPLVFILAGRWAKQIDRVIVLRLGVVFLSIFFLVVLMLGKLASSYPILLGVLLGIGYGFYWLAFNVLTFEITEPETRDIFNGFFGLLSSLAGMTGPFFAGWLITRMDNFQGYTIIFALSLALFVLAVILSFFLKRRSAEGSFELLHVIRWSEISDNWKWILLGNTAQGLREGAFAFLITVWIYIATKTEFALGTFSLVTSSVSFVTYYLAGRFIMPKNRKRMILYSAIVLSIAVWIIAFQLSFSNLMIYGVLISIAFPTLMVPFLSMTYDVIGRAKNAALWRVEYIVVREIFLNAGRVLSILFFLLAVTWFEEKQAMSTFILIFGNAQLLLYLFIRQISLPTS